MKHRIFFFSLFLITTGIQAQIYIGISGGYGIPFAKERVGSVIQWDSAYHSVTSVMGSYGAGQHYTLYGGYSLNENIGVELGANYLSGKKYTSAYANNYNNYSYNYESQVKSLRLVTSLRFTFGKKRINYYFKSGIVSGLFSQIRTNSAQVRGQEHTVWISKAYGGIMLGVAASAGANFAVNKKLSLFLEANSIGMHWAALKRKTIKYEINGVNNLSTLPASQPYSTNEGKQYLPMSAVGLSIGLHFNF
ncbi:MAG: hypothetical protein M3R17_18680 [Bacteroidota bacterium]|nr:hypothetical protein [Bacteroidota bacterium]